MPAERLACLFVPLFPLAARLRSEPELSGEAVAIVSGVGGAARLVAVSRRARRAGVRAGFSLAQARAVIPNLTVRPSDRPCERSAQEALLEAAESFSPRVEDAAPGVVYLDIAGLDRHFPGDRPERALAQSLIAAAEAAGLPARAGIASGKLAARVAAGLPASPTVVAAGEEAAFLAPLSLARLHPPAEIVETLTHWGLATAGDFARLPEGEVASRLGEAGRDLHRMARGEDPRPLTPRVPPPTFEEGMELDWALATIEPFLFIARGALERLSERLGARALACRRLDVTLTLDPDGVDARTVELPAPTRDVRSLLSLLRLDLEKKPPGAPVSGFLLTAHPDRPRQSQLSMFGPPAIAPDRLAVVLARLAALVGPERVGAPRQVDRHMPETFGVEAYDPPAPPEIAPALSRGRGLLAVRAVRPAAPLEVIADARDRPGAVRSRDPRRLPKLEGNVRVASGPWRLEEEWWNDAAAADRDYWDVEIDGGGIYRIFRDRRTGEWAADGVYD